jgi:DNA repair protein RecN (Recombination protein N)
LANAERLYTAVNESYEALYGNKQGLDWITKSKQRISDVTKFYPVALNPLLDQLQSAYFQLEDAAYQLRDYREKIEFNPNKLDQLEQRLQLIHSLKRKYGETVEKIIEYAASIRVKVDNLEQQEERIASLTHEKNKIELELREVANALTAIRLVTAKQLSTSLMENLKDLHMDKTIFTVEHVLTSGQWPSEGVDRMEFMIAPNPGEPLKSIARIASGGELSRIMLALKSLFVAVDHVPVLIFDEVDTGVSGRAAQAIAEKMAALAKHAQVFSVTHLPQVACMADHHYAIEKRVHVDRTYTLVTPLEQPDRINELARMLGGVEITESAIQHAQEMLNLATVHKANWNEGR